MLFMNGSDLSISISIVFACCTSHAHCSLLTALRYIDHERLGWCFVDLIGQHRSRIRHTSADSQLLVDREPVRLWSSLAFYTRTPR